MSSHEGEQRVREAVSSGGAQRRSRERRRRHESAGARGAERRATFEQRRRHAAATRQRTFADRPLLERAPGTGSGDSAERVERLAGSRAGVGEWVRERPADEASVASDVLRRSDGPERVHATVRDWHELERAFRDRDGAGQGRADRREGRRSATDRGGSDSRLRVRTRRGQVTGNGRSDPPATGPEQYADGPSTDRSGAVDAKSQPIHGATSDVGRSDGGGNRDEDRQSEPPVPAGCGASRFAGYQ